MTVNTTKITSGPYAGNGIADTFSYTFKVADKTQLSVYETDTQGLQTLLTVDTHYTVAGVGDDSGGIITRVAGALPTGHEWYIRSNYKETQLTAFTSQGPFFPDTHEDAMDKLTFLIQQLLDEKDRSPSVSTSYSGPLPLTLDDPISQSLIRWKADLTGFENVNLSELSPDIISSDSVVYSFNDITDLTAVGMSKVTPVMIDSAGKITAKTQENSADTGFGGADHVLTKRSIIRSEKNEPTWEPTGGDSQYLYGGQASDADPYVSLELNLPNRYRGETRDILRTFGVSQNVVVEAEQCMLEKLRTDFLEFAVYTPMSNDGRFWHRWLFTNRFNVTNDGAPRMINCSLAGLNPSNPVVRTPANNVSETTGTATTVTKASADAVQVGTWSAPAVVLTTSDVSWSATIGDTCTYTITGVERLHLRGLYAGNGGIGKITITESAVEIDEANYLLPSDHLVNFISTATGNTTMHIPLADGLDTAKTYVVEIEVDTTNPGANRVYQAGLLGYDDIAFNAVGIHGIVLDASLGGQTNSMSVTSGTTAVYAFTDVTKVVWSYVETNVASIAEFTVYDSTGTEITEYQNQTLDMYGVGSTAKNEVIATNLVKGDYYLHVKNGKTKNASSTAHRYYDFGVIGYDQNLAGVIGVDQFDDFDMPKIVQDPNNDSGQGTEYMLIGSGNLEMAIGVRKTTEPAGDEEFLGGIHGNETTPVPVFYANNAVIDFAGGAQFDTWLAKDFRIEFTTTLSFAVDSSNFCTVDYTFSFSQSGYGVTTTKTTLADSYVHDEFTIMLNSPNTDTSQGIRQPQGLSVGGGFKHVAADQNYVIDQFDNGGTFIPQLQESVAFINDEYAAIASYTTALDGSVFNYPPYDVGRDNCLIQDRTDRTVKFYTRAFSGNDAAGVLVPAGESWTHDKMYRVHKGNYKLAFGIKG